jgi:hypothetical protein
MIIKRDWLKELARDFVALGSLPFLVLVIARVFILAKPYYLSQFIISAGIFLLLIIWLKYDLHSGIGLIILIFTLIYYQELKFSIFAIFIFCGFIISLVYIKKDKKKIIQGIFFGAVSSVIGYNIVKFIFDI